MNTLGGVGRAALGALVCFALCASAAAEGLRLAVARGPVSLPVYVAHAKGLFEAEGVAVQLQECASGRACFELLADDRADLATAAELIVTLASFKDARFAILASLSSSVHQIKLAARRSAGIEGAASLRGKRIGTVAGTSAHYFLDTWLLFHGIDASAVALRPLKPDQLAPALQRHEVDAVAIWEPHASAARTLLGDDAVLLPSPRVYTQHFVLASARDTIAAREADLLKLLRALARAEALIATRPQDARAILAERLQLTPELAEAQLREHDYRLRIDQTLVATMDNQARWAVHAGLVETGRKPANLLRAIEPALLGKAVPRSVELAR